MILKQSCAIFRIFLCLSLTFTITTTTSGNTNKCCMVLFSHGIADTFKQAFWYARSYTYNNIKYYNDRHLFACPFVTFNYPDATEGIMRVKRHETSFGQKNEIIRLYSAYKKAKKWSRDKWDNCNIILFGLSRGASNLGIFAGRHGLSNVKAMILESPYYTMSEVIAHMLQKNKLTWVPLSYGESLAEFIFPRYSRYGNSPASAVEHIRTDMPILIICSKADQLVPYTSSINVYKKLVATGHQHAYILVLNHGRHAKILSDKDGHTYQAVVHAFYKKYNLSYDPSLANIGEPLLEQCQPDL